MRIKLRIQSILGCPDNGKFHGNLSLNQKSNSEKSDTIPASSTHQDTKRKSLDSSLHPKLCVQPNLMFFCKLFFTN